jgi:hypothetical protein
MSGSLGASNPWNPLGLSIPVEGLIYKVHIITVFGVRESYTDCHVLCEVRAWPKNELSIDCVPCEAAAEAEKTVEHLAYNTVQHNQMATVRGVKLTLYLF